MRSRLNQSLARALPATPELGEARRGQSALPLGFGVALGALWGFHAAAFSYPGRAYFSLVKLNDVSKAVGLGVLLHPSFVFAALVIALTGTTQRRLQPVAKCGVTVGLALWLIGATFGTLSNPAADQVLLTYCSVFLAGAAMYLAFASVSFTARDFEMGVLGLAAGSLFPLIGGLVAFVREWGVPDTTTALSAYQNLLRMELYEAATFGNRGNTALFLVIVAPFMLSVALDRSRSRWVRLVCAAVLVPITLNLIVLQVRAAFIVLLLTLMIVWGFRTGIRRFPLFALAFGVALVFMLRYSPDIAQVMSDRLVPVITADAEADTSVRERAESIREGVRLAERNWQFGIGPGGALTQHSQTSAHQFQVQQFMETGILGLLGSLIFSVGVLLMLVKTLRQGQDGGVNNIRFALLVGPASFVLYGLLANATFNVGYVNTWDILIVSMLALAPGFPLRAQGKVAGWPPLRTRAAFANGANPPQSAVQLT